MGRLPVNYSKYVLIDANVVVGYYLQESLSSTRARERIQSILNSVKSQFYTDLCILIPNICIPEVFGVFSKYRFAKWDRHVKKVTKKISQKEYLDARESFHNDLHNGSLFQQIELNRYHILATDLISPIDAFYEFYRHRANGKKKPKRMMGGTDHAIIGMGIYLNKIFGNTNFAILTADDRLSDILTRAISIKMGAAKKLGLIETAKSLTMEYSPSIYPQAINLSNASHNSLRNFLNVWPLPDKPIVNLPLKDFTEDDCKLLSEIRRQFNIPRDKLPYTHNFDLICAEFERLKCQKIDKSFAWRNLSNYEKRPKK